LVESSRLLPRVSLPLRRASAMMFSAARSLTEPPGLNHSAFPYSLTFGKARTTRSRCSSGVLPTSSNTRDPAAAAGRASGRALPCGRELCTCELFEARVGITHDQRNLAKALANEYLDYAQVQTDTKKFIPAALAGNIWHLSQ